MNHPKIYVGVPTGASKEYAILYMLASLRNVDYPKDRLKITFSVTHKGDRQSEKFLQRLRQLLEAANMQCNTNMLITYPTQEDMNRWGPYYAVIVNLHAMRLDFLSENHDYFWLLGGDNPPPRKTLRSLLKLKADVASATINQRREKIEKHHMDTSMVYPVYWQYLWTLKDLKELDLEPVLHDELRRTWTEFMFLGDTSAPTNKKILRNVVFGSGCSLIRRRVFEYIGYALGAGGTHSEDLHFCSLANTYGFTTALDLEARCLHFDPDGKVY